MFGGVVEKLRYRAWFIVRGIQKIDGKEAQQAEADAHRGNRKWGCGRVEKDERGRSTEIRLNASDTKKSMISFGTRRDDSRIHWFLFRSLSFTLPPACFAACPYYVSLIVERAAIPVRVYTTSRAYRIDLPSILIARSIPGAQDAPRKSNVTKYTSLSWRSRCWQLIFLHLFVMFY